MQNAISYWQSCWQKSVSDRWVIHSRTIIYDSDTAVFMAVLEWVMLFSIFFFPNSIPNPFKCWIQHSSGFAIQVLHKEQVSDLASERMPVAYRVNWVTVIRATSSSKVLTKCWKIAVSHWQGADCSLLPPTERVNQVNWLHQPELPYTLREMSNRLQSTADLAGSGLNSSTAACCLQLLLLLVRLWAGGGTLKLYLIMLNTHELVYCLLLIKGF